MDLPNASGFVGGSGERNATLKKASTAPLSAQPGHSNDDLTSGFHPLRTLGSCESSAAAIGNGSAKAHLQSRMVSAKPHKHGGSLVISGGQRMHLPMGTEFSGSAVEGEEPAKRILIIEDSPLISVATEEILLASGYVPLGPAGNMASALALVENEEMDAAIVDLNIRGSKSFSLFSILARREIPFLIVSGYADWKMPDEWSSRPRLQKPFSEAGLREAIAALLSDGSREPHQPD